MTHGAKYSASFLFTTRKDAPALTETRSISSLSKKQFILSREITLNTFLSELCPFFRLSLFDHYQALNSQGLAPSCSALVELQDIEANSSNSQAHYDISPSYLKMLRKLIYKNVGPGGSVVSISLA